VARIHVSRWFATLLPLTSLLLTPQSRSQCVPPLPSTCSYTGLNGRECKIVIDRSFPAAPATLYIRRGGTIDVFVVNPSPFEQLSLDFSSAKAVVPTDTFQALMSGQSGNLQKLSVLDLTTARVAQFPPTPVSPPSAADQVKTTLEDISSDQSKIYGIADLNTFLATLAPIIASTIPASACDDALAFSKGQPGSTGLVEPNPWYNFVAWQKTAINKTALDPDSHQVDPTAVANKISDLDSKIAAVTKMFSKLTTDEQSGLKPTLDTVNQNQATLKIRTDLVQWILRLPVKTQTTFKLRDHPSSAGDWTQATWNLNAVNNASVETKRLTASAYKPAQPTDALISPPTKNSIAAVTAQFQSIPRLEFSTGLMVPARPFHSYAIAAVAANGSITGNVVQESLTYTVVPLALVNFNIAQRIVRRQPVAAFVSLGTGYNPATSAVEFGAGGGLSWKSLQLGILADIGRDTHLAGGFYTGESLPASNPPKPLTTTVWSLRPAISLSVRIPITGAAK
jgi:hypothetical protein